MAQRSSISAAALDPWRTAADRRDSARVTLPLLVRDVTLGGSFDEYPGNLGLGGAYFEALHSPTGSRLQLRFLLPGLREEIRAEAEVVRVSRERDRFGAHLRFVELSLEAELAIARYLQT